MTKCSRVLVLSAAMAAALLPLRAHATANYSYKKHEYRIIAGGIAPNRRLSIAAHGSGEFGYDGFHLYLMAEPAHRKLARLQRTGQDSILDTAADAFHAQWAADSGRVAVLFRAERHVIAVRLYVISHRRRYLSPGPDLLDEVLKKGSGPPADYSLRASHSDFAWLSAKRFVLKEDRILAASSELARRLGAFAKLIPGNGPPEQKPPELQLIHFSADAICELGRRHGYRILELKPGGFIY